MINENFMLTEEQVKKYLKRIKMSYPLEATLENLHKLQLNHLKYIPYENLSILYGEPISLDGQDLYEKIIVNERGGFCFETNALYQWLLKAIGYQVTSYYTRLIGLPPEEQLKRHRMIRVDFADASYITDVGIRIALSRKALRLEKNKIQTDGHSDFRYLSGENQGWNMQYKRKNHDWENVFSFHQEAEYEKDFIMPAFYCEKHPESPFRQGPQMSIFTDKGQITIANKLLTISNETKIIERRELSSEKFEKYCKKYFQINLSDFQHI